MMNEPAKSIIAIITAQTPIKIHRQPAKVDIFNLSPQLGQTLAFFDTSFEHALHLTNIDLAILYTSSIKQNFYVTNSP
jgi:hypothetical protein